MQRVDFRVHVLIVLRTCLEPPSQQEGALRACFRRLDAEANGIISRSDIERQETLDGVAARRCCCIPPGPLEKEVLTKSSGNLSLKRDIASREL